MVGPLQVQDVEQSRHQALAALVSSIAARTAESSSGNLTPERVQTIANQLSDIFGDVDFTGASGEGTMSNDNQVLNEDGEPVMEIIEKIPEPVESLMPPPGASVVGDAPLGYVKFARSALPDQFVSPEVLKRRRQERDSILAALEADEEAGGELEELDGAKGERAVSSSSLPNLPSFSSVTSSVVQSSSSILPRPNQSSFPDNSPPATSPPPKKTVTFAPGVPSPPKELPAVENVPNVQSWGDVIPAKLRETQQPAALRAVRMSVVERAPGASAPSQSAPKRRPVIRVQEVDSDDEDEEVDENPTDGTDPTTHDPPFASATAAAIPLTHPPTLEARIDAEWKDFEHEMLHGGIEEDEDDDGEDGLDEFDEAMMHREIALEYAKREAALKEAIAASVADAQDSSSSHGPVPSVTDHWDREYVPLEANLASRTTSSVSRFKANLLTPKPDPLPSNPVLAKAIRHGKLEDGKLVARDGHYEDPSALSDDDDDFAWLGEDGKRIIDAIRGGEVLVGQEEGDQEGTSEGLFVNVGPGLQTPLQPASDRGINPPIPSTSSSAPFKPSQREHSASSISLPPKVPSSVLRAGLSRATPIPIPIPTAPAPIPIPTAPTPIPIPMEPQVYPSARQPNQALGSAKTALAQSSKSSPSPAQAPNPSIPPAKTSRFKQAIKAPASPTSQPALTASSIPVNPRLPGPSSTGSFAFSHPNLDVGPDPSMFAGFTSTILTPEEAAAPVTGIPIQPPSAAPPQKKEAMGFNVIENPRGSSSLRLRDTSAPPNRVSRFKAEREGW